MLKLNKNQLDTLGTLFGLLAAICSVLLANGVGNPKMVGTIGGISTALLGYVVQRPAEQHPTTEEAEENVTR